jgi:UDP-2,4-diacetamido-2,4,6-trideoxy-beta-L-altropyranose hydrolase
VKFIFRSDASIEIGTGHVMRCLTLAEEIARLGHECFFICREHEGHLGGLIRRKGFGLYLLKNDVESCKNSTPLNWNDHAHWLGTTQENDAEQCLKVVENINPDWMVVDHYSLDKEWELRMQTERIKIVVIDDLADRLHQANILMDQTFGRQERNYIHLVPDDCELLVGSQFALLRREFSEYRKLYLGLRNHGAVKKLLINLGGIDKDNFTQSILGCLQTCNLPADLHITVVLGERCPWVESVKKIAKAMKWKTDVIVGSQNMAELMMNSDFAIGAAGSTTWERCVLGLPTIQVVIARNQSLIAEELAKVNAVKVLDRMENLKPLVEGVENWSHAVSLACREVTDGLGVKRVIEAMGITE